jgi:hypothetical protein
MSLFPFSFLFSSASCQLSPGNRLLCKRRKERITLRSATYFGTCFRDASPPASDFELALSPAKSPASVLVDHGNPRMPDLDIICPLNETRASNRQVVSYDVRSCTLILLFSIYIVPCIGTSTVRSSKINIRPPTTSILTLPLSYLHFIRSATWKWLSCTPGDTHRTPFTHKNANQSPWPGYT